MLDKATTHRKPANITDMKGELFEIKMNALLFLRGVNSGLDFQMATNVKDAGTFDDIVFRVKTSDKVWQTCFIQLKHKQAGQLTRRMLLAAKGDFALKKYYASFVNVKKVMAKENKLSILDGTFDYSHFVIFTNTSQPNDSINQRVTTYSPMHAFLRTGVESEFVSSFTEEADADIIAALEAVEADARDFLKKFRLFTGEPAQHQLDDFIEMEMRVYCKREGLNYIDLMYLLYERAFRNWWQKDKCIDLDKNSPILIKALQKADHMIFSALSGGYGIYFREKYQSDLPDNNENGSGMVLSQVVRKKNGKRNKWVSPSSYTFTKLHGDKRGTKVTLLQDPFHMKKRVQESLNSILQKEVIFQGKLTKIDLILGSDLDVMSNECRDVIDAISK